MRALSGLTPALSRRLQQQLLAHLPPAAARSLRRTLSLHCAAPAPRAHRPYTRSHSATKPLAAEPAPTDSITHETITTQKSTENANTVKPLENTDPPECAPTDSTNHDTTPTQHSLGNVDTVVPLEDTNPANIADLTLQNTNDIVKDDRVDVSAPHFSTLPRLRRHSTRSRESTPPIATSTDAGYDYTPKVGSLAKELSHSRGSSIRSTPDRPLLSKYLTPDRNISLDESYSSDSGSILSEPSYIAAYGAPAIGGLSGLGFRRHSMRLAGEQPRKRISRFLRPDFYDTPAEESVYAKHKKEKELETQKILREIREKKNRSLDSSAKSPTEPGDIQHMFKDEVSYSRKCLSPIAILTGKERSRSNTPFFPILDNIKESTMDTSLKLSESVASTNVHHSGDTKYRSPTDDILASKESKLTRPKSYPVKSLEPYRSSSQNISSDISNKESENKEMSLHRESKLIRPKSYPTSSPSPEKLYVNRNVKKDETKITSNEANSSEANNDVEVSFHISLPKKKTGLTKTDSLKKSESIDKDDIKTEIKNESVDSNNLAFKKCPIIKNNESDKPELKDQKPENGCPIGSGVSLDNVTKVNSDENTNLKTTNHESKNENMDLKTTDTGSSDKKGTIKKKIIKKVSSKTKTDIESNQESSDAKASSEKKKVTKKVKEKVSDSGAKTNATTKKKSVLQSIGHKLEKLASTKSSSPEKNTDSNILTSDTKKDTSKLSRMQREQSVPVNVEPPTESNLIKRAVTLSDVAGLENQNTIPTKTTVSKVLGLFKKFEPKDKRNTIEKTHNENLDANTEANKNSESISQSISESSDKDKPKRPTSLLLNGLGRKHKYGRAASDSVSVTSADNDEQSTTTKKEKDSKNLRNSLKLDFSRLPRVKKIVPTNPVIEPQVMDVSSVDKEIEKKDTAEKNDTVSDGINNRDTADSVSRSRSRSRSSFSNSDLKSDLSDVKDKHPLSPSESTVYHHPVRNHEPTTPEKEDIVDRIRRKSFYTRFNEKKQRRKSNLVGPGASEYDPVARLHSQSTDTKFDVSPTSPGTYDLSPGFSVASDLSPSTERYRSLLTDLPISNRNNIRFDNYGFNDKIDTYRSLDRNDFRKYPGSKSYMDYDPTLSYGTHKYSRTKSLLDSSDGADDHSLGHLRDPHKYNRTISMYSPDNYATYRPKRTRNSAIILKESEKEPSPENILDKIKQRKKMSIGVTRKPDPDKDSLSRSNVPLKSEGDSTERSEKID